MSPSDERQAFEKLEQYVSLRLSCYCHSNPKYPKCENCIKAEPIKHEIVRWQARGEQEGASPEADLPGEKFLNDFLNVEEMTLTDHEKVVVLAAMAAFAQYRTHHALKSLSARYEELVEAARGVANFCKCNVLYSYPQPWSDLTNELFARLERALASLPEGGETAKPDDAKRLRQFQNDLGNYEGQCRLADKPCDANAFNAGWLAHEKRSNV